MAVAVAVGAGCVCDPPRTGTAVGAPGRGGREQAKAVGLAHWRQAAA